VVEYADKIHTHPISDVTGLQANLTDIEADVDAIEARDWVAVTANTIDEANPIADWPSGRESFMITSMGIAQGYPENTGIVYVDRRYREQTSNDFYGYRTFQNSSGSNVYFQASDSSTWQPWQKNIASESGVISDALTFSGQLEATGQALVTDDSLVTRAGVSTFYTHGIEDHNSTDAAFSPSAGVRTKVVNNGLGTFTNTSYKIPGRGDIWDAAAGEFNFLDAGLKLGDTVTIRMDFELTTTSANDGFKVELDLGTGAGLYTLTLADQYYRFTGTNNFTIVSEIYMGDTNTLNNPATIYITPDAGGTTVNYNGHYVKYALQNLSLT